jgi:hypothetical protein
MDYKKIYDEICQRAKNELEIRKTNSKLWKKTNGDLGIYYEGHHIIPKCMGGKGYAYDLNHPNIAPLTAREHFLVHRILANLYSNNIKLTRSFWGMCNQDKHGNRYIPNSKEYEEARILFSKSISGDNHFNKKPENKIKLVWTKERRDKDWSGWKMNDEGRKKIKESWTEERKIKHKKNNPANSDKAIQKRIASMIGSNNWTATKIAQYSIDGSFIKEYGSISEALTELGRNVGISAVCNGRAKTAGGFIWKKV